MYADYHMHTYYSDDSNYEMKKAVEKAICLGIEEICFTDHVDYGIKIEYKDYKKLSKVEQKNCVYNVDYEAYFKEIEELKKVYKNRIQIKKGMEFGVQMHTIPAFQRLHDMYTFDFIILSCHQIENKEFWTQDFQNGKTQKEYNERYYQEILNVIREYKAYSVLGHLDLIKRYDLAGSYPFEYTKELVVEILKTVIKDGKGIEVNTSSFRYGLDDLMPSRDLLTLYHNLGGTILSVGSDAHQEDHVGVHIEDVKVVLKEIGFEYVCTYNEMTPVFHKL